MKLIDSILILILIHEPLRFSIVENYEKKNSYIFNVLVKGTQFSVDERGITFFLFFLNNSCQENFKWMNLDFYSFSLSFYSALLFLFPSINKFGFTYVSLCVYQFICILVCVWVAKCVRVFVASQIKTIGADKEIYQYSQKLCKDAKFNIRENIEKPYWTIWWK